MRYVLIFCLLFGGCSLPHDLNTGKPILWSEVPDYFFGPFFRDNDEWDFWDDPLRQKQQCKGLKEGEHCMDLTKRMGGMEGTIFKDLKPIKGWRQTGCIHSKQVNPLTDKENMYCEYCNKEGKQMWMIYDYEKKTWQGDSHYFSCGTRLELRE